MKFLIALWLATCGADAASTHVGLQHGATELLLPTQSPLVIDGIVSGEAAAGVWATRRLWLTGHKKKAIVLTLVATGIHGWAAYHNVEIIQGRPR